MRTKKLNFYKFSLCVGLLLTLLILSTVMSNNIGYAQGTLINNTAIAETYLIGENFTLPTNVKLEDNGKQYNADVVLRDPDNLGLVSPIVKLTKRGKYVLEYKALTDSNALITSTQSFTCLDKLYEVTGDKSEVAYGANSKYPDANKGVAVKLASGEALKFNKTIDISKFSDTQSVVDFYVAPNNIFVPDVKQIEVIFTDAFDKTNFVSVAVKKATAFNETDKWAEVTSYLVANAAFQVPTGLEFSASGETAWNKNLYKLHRNDMYGAPYTFSLSGGFNGTAAGEGILVGKESMKIGWDYDKRQVLAIDGKTSSKIVVDLDEPIFFSDLWKGFTTGEVFVSIKASAYLASSANIVVTKVGGIDLTANSTEDTVAPIITVNYGDYAADSIPTAKTGKAYPIFGATASDILDGDIKVTTTVWSNYGKTSESICSVTNNSFVPVRDGIYSIVYTATDKTGNESKEVVEIEAKSSVVSLNGKTTTEKVLSGKIGESVIVADFEYYDGTGNVSLSIAATNKANSSVVYKIDKGELSFFPMYAGEYSIDYTFSDYISTNIYSYVVTIQSSDIPLIIDSPILPQYFIKNGSYLIPKLNGYISKDDQMQMVECSMLVKQDMGDTVLITDNKVKIVASKKVTITYQLAKGKEITRKTYEVPVVDVGFGAGNALDLTKYFIGDNFNSVAENFGLTYSVPNSKAVNGKASLSFVKVILANDFNFLFSINRLYDKYGKLNIYLKDSLDSSVELKLSYIKNAVGVAEFSLNDSASKINLGRSFSVPELDYSASYSQVEKTVSVSTTQKIKVDTDYNGKSFVGFPSNFVYLVVELEDITPSLKNSSGVTISKINNQSLSQITADIIEPEITANTLRGERLIGDKVYIAPTYAADVLDPYIDFKMKVIDGEKKVVTATDGTVLENCDPLKQYEIILEKFGSYIVEYKATDTSGWETIYSYVIMVIDNQAPTITYQGKHVTEAKLNAVVKVAEVTVEDNKDTEIIIEMYVKTPAGKMLSLSLNLGETKHDSFIAKEVGVYTIYYYALDKQGNSTIISYDVKVV